MQFAPENAVSIGTAVGLVISTVWLHSRISEVEERLQSLDTSLEEMKEVMKGVLPVKDVAHKAREDIARIQAAVSTVKSYRHSTEELHDDDDDFDEDLINEAVNNL